MVSVPAAPRPAVLRPAVLRPAVLRPAVLRPVWLAGRVLPAAAAVSLLLTGCAGASPTAAAAPSRTPGAVSPSPAPLTGDLVVFAAASLQQTFTRLGDLLMAQHPDLHVTFSFGASSTLAQQLDQGAPADVFASANAATMAAASGVTEAPVTFAHNSLEIVVPAGNPGHVTGLADFARPRLKIAVCAVEVPCGSAAATAFAAAGVTPAPDTYEKDVTAALTKAVLGEVDAALVYRTDVRSAGAAVQGIDFPQAAAARNDYPIATVVGSHNAEAARAFVALVLSAEGQRVLTDAGFDAA